MNDSYEFQSEDEREYFEERAVIIEADARWSRERSERVAWRLTLSRRAKLEPLEHA